MSNNQKEINEKIVETLMSLYILVIDPEHEYTDKLDEYADKIVTDNLKSLFKLTEVK